MFEHKSKQGSNLDMTRRAAVMAIGAMLLPSLINDVSASPVEGGADKDFDHQNIKAIVFDTVGTLVDSYGTIVGRGSEITRAKGLNVNWDAIFIEWNAKWRSQLNDIISGKIAWRSSDVIFRDTFDEICANYEWGTYLNSDDKDRINYLWYQLKAWDDTKPGLERLRNRYILSTLSNNSMASLINFAKQDRLPFDCILTAELVRSGKPDPKVYALAAQTLNLRPDQILMIAAHKYDLAAAKRYGFHVAFLPRPFENGPNRQLDTKPEDFYALSQPDLVQMAAALGA